MKKYILIFGVPLLVVFLIVFIVLWRTISSPWPQTRGELALPGLQDQVEVLRDDRGIPHIYASNPHDLFMAQGFVHAQDRFWQMEFWRRIGAGRLSELFGESQLDTDRFLRTLGIVPAAEETWKALDPETRAALTAYADGVNAYIEQNKDDLPLEFKVLKLTGVAIEPEPWTPINTLTWVTLMSFDLGGNYKSELRRAQLMAIYGETWMRELMDLPYAESRPTIVPEGIAWEKLSAGETLAHLPDGRLLGWEEGVGSNNWVVAGSRTETGLPLLANDPHLSMQMPSIWYENGLHCEPFGPDCPYDVVGFSFASAPGVIIGHNQRIAWGVTNVGPDVQDLYIERINPDNPNQYEVNGQWVDMTLRQETIRIAGEEEPVTITVRSTRHGPIINDVAYGADSDWAYGWQPLALQWTALGVNRTAQSILALNRATDWTSFRDALRYWDAPSQNFVYADVDGNIGYQMPGLIPIRAQGQGEMPVPGWNDEYAWNGFIPFDELPSVFNPEQGYVVTANNRVIDPDYPYFISKEWAPGYRAQRIVEMIESKQTLTIDDFKQMQGDNANLFAQAVIPILAKVNLDRPEVAAMRDELLRWDTQQDVDSREALFFEDFYYQLIPAIYHDELGELTPGPRPSTKRRVELLMNQPDSHWWDNIHTPAIETREDILAQALNAAYDDLVERLGEDSQAWRWGDLHTTTFRNQTLGESGIGLIEAIFNRGPFETAGGTSIVNATSWKGEEPNPFEVVWLPSLRMIVDMSDFSRSLTINTTGQSGHPYHKHYVDQSADWAAIRYAPMLWERGKIETQAEGRLILRPSP